MSEHRKKLDGFSWPSHLHPEIRWLARDRFNSFSNNGDWFGFQDKPYIDDRWCWRDNSGCRTYLGMLSLPQGGEPLLLCRDDYETPSRSVTFHGVNSGDGESFRWGEVPTEEVLAICGEFANPGQSDLSPVEVLYYLGAMDGKRRKFTITVEDME